jgi:hypothetical protein
MLHLLRDPRPRYLESVGNKAAKPGWLGWELARWLRSEKLARKNQRKYPRQYKIILFERLAQQTGTCVEEICEFIGENYSPELIAEANTYNWGSPNGSTLSKAETAFFQLYAGKALERWSYPLDSTNFHLRDIFWFLLKEFPLNTATRFAWEILRGINPA